jgi:hypothetical protein
MHNADGGLLAISPDDEEVVSFDRVEEELEPQGEVILYRGKEYEYSYEDAGTVSEVDGDADATVEDRLTFSDYESEDGELIRAVTSENTGETQTYLGNLVVEEDILPIES